MDDAHIIAAAAARGFPVLQCEACVASIRKALVAGGFQGQVVELRCRDRCEFMVCMSYQEGRTTITENGRHVGVRVGDMVIDNLHPGGMLYDNWVQDFDAAQGITASVASIF